MSPRHHVVISGTGRAGTTFLVRFLEQCGLDVGAVDSAEPRELGHARAGFEHNLLDAAAPYIVKDPWLFTYCDEVDTDAVRVDALIVPVRDLAASATSRVFQERIAIAETTARHNEPKDVRGAVDGGVIYSLDPVDEARILAVGFHKVLRWATVNEMPVFLLDFPRAVTDGDYLISVLGPWLDQHCDREKALAAFAATADPSAVRFTAAEPSPRAVSSAPAMPAPAELDRRAFAALLDEREAELRASTQALEQARLELAAATQPTDDRCARAEIEQRLAGAQTVIDDLSNRLDAARTDRDAILRSTSWRLTRPVRAMTKLLRR